MDRAKSSDDRRKADLAQIHIAKKALGLDDDTYRAFLQGAAGVDSAGKLSFVQRQVVLGLLRDMGWNPGKPGEKKAKKVPKGSQLSKIWALWFDLYRMGKVRDKSATALTAFAKRMTEVDRLEWLTSEQSNVVIEALKDWQRRKD